MTDRGKTVDRGASSLNPNDRHRDPGVDPDLPMPGEIIARKYEVEQVLGAGGMGIVVAARHMQLGQRVAIKFMRGHMAHDPSAVERFLREARAAVALTSEHVARVLDVGTLESGAPYMVLEHLSGVDLEQVVRRDGPMSVPAAVGIVLQACEAIAEAHSLGIVHRDLKPANLFVTARMDGSRLVKVLDFGISKAAQGEGAAQNLTASGVAMGSPAYMSPEQIRSAKGVDSRSDIWSLGVILYELVTGVSPFLGESLGDTFAKIVSEAPAPLRERRADVPKEFAAIVDQCLQRKVEARVPTVGQLAAKLARFAPKDAAVSIERIQRISGLTQASTITAPETILAPTDGGPMPSGTAQAWLRSGSAHPRAPHARLAVAIGAGVAVLGTLGAGAAYHFRTSSSVPSPSSSPAASDSPAAVPAPAMAAPSVGASIEVPTVVAAPPEATSLGSDAGRPMAAALPQRHAPEAPGPKTPTAKPAGPGRNPPPASSARHEIDVF